MSLKIQVLPAKITKIEIYTIAERIANRFSPLRSDIKMSNVPDGMYTSGNNFTINLPCTHTFSGVPQHFSILRMRFERRLSDENVARFACVRDTTDNHDDAPVPRECVCTLTHVGTHAC